MNSIECALVGRLGSDPERKVSKSGNTWARFSVAVGEGDETQWVTICAFKDAATKALDRLHKGDRCYVEGTIKLNKWPAQDGAERSGLQVSCFKAEPIGQIGGRKLPTAKADGDGDRAPPAANRHDRPFDDRIPF